MCKFLYLFFAVSTAYTNNWIDIFQLKSFSNLDKKEWKVKKDKGQFDYVTGATITPRAVIKAIYNALEYFEQNKKELGFSDV